MLRVIDLADQPARLHAPLPIELTRMSYRPCNDATADSNAGNKAPITADLPVGVQGAVYRGRARAGRRSFHAAHVRGAGREERRNISSGRQAVAAFMAAQLVGVLAAVMLGRWLWRK
jgi:hypothetical protein